LTKGTILEVNVSELGLVTTSGKVVWSKYAQVTNNPENDGCVNTVLCTKNPCLTDEQKLTCSGLNIVSSSISGIGGVRLLFGVSSYLSHTTSLLASTRKSVAGLIMYMYLLFCTIYASLGVKSGLSRI